VSSKRLTRTSFRIDIVRPMTIKGPAVREAMQRANQEYRDFNTRVFWVACFVSITVFFA
jgi:hypothetical protein